MVVDAPCNGSANAEVQQAFDARANILYEDWIGCGGIGFSRSLDGGYTFAPAVTVLGSTFPLSVGSWDPAIAVAPNGTVYLSFMADVPTSMGDRGTPVVTWSWDQGRTFAGTSPVYLPGPNTFADRDYLAVAPDGSVDVTWNLAPNGSYVAIQCAPYASCYYAAGDFNGMFVTSHTGGRSWSTPIAINPDYPNGGVIAAPLLVEPNGTIDVLYEDYSIRNWTTHALGVGYNFFSRSIDGGRTFRPGVPVSTLPVAPNVWWIDGWISRDAAGTLYASFDSQNGANDTAYVTLSRDDGATWGRAIRLNPDTGSSPHIMVTATGVGNGSAYIAFMTNNTTTAQWSTWLEVLSQYGQYLSAPMRVSAQLGNPFNWTGDTIGVADLGGGRVDVVWSYGINDSLGIARSQIVEAPVSLPSPSTAPKITPGAAQVYVSWPTPAAGVVITGTTVYWSADGGPVRLDFVAGAFTGTTVANLSTGVPYTFAIGAQDAFGPGVIGPETSVTLTAWGAIAGNVTSRATVTVDGKSVPIRHGAYFENGSMGPHVVVATAPPTGGVPGSITQTVFVPWNRTVHLDFNFSTPIPPSIPGPPPRPIAVSAWVYAGLGVAVAAVGAVAWWVGRRQRRPMP